MKQSSLLTFFRGVKRPLESAAVLSSTSQPPTKLTKVVEKSFSTIPARIKLDDNNESNHSSTASTASTTKKQQYEKTIEKKETTIDQAPVGSSTTTSTKRQRSTVDDDDDEATIDDSVAKSKTAVSSSSSPRASPKLRRATTMLAPKSSFSSSPPKQPFSTISNSTASTTSSLSSTDKSGSKLVSERSLTKTTKLQIRLGDIVREHVDVIVNAANGNLAHGSGVAGALRRAAGPSLQRESDDYVRKHGSSTL